MAEVAKLIEQINGLTAEDRAKLGLEIVKNLTMLEISNWVSMMEEEFGVTAAAPVAVAAVGAVAGGEGAGAVAEEPTEFNVMLMGSGEKKIQVIKEVRAITNLGLKEAKDLVDNPPKAVKENVSKEEAQEIKKKLEEVGATIEIKAS
ncbi:MAG: 50S ribosomal protein L7/L12 [Candidatus Auribacterota bacterium]